MLKRRHGLDRSRYKGDDGIKRWVGLGDRRQPNQHRPSKDLSGITFPTGPPNPISSQPLPVTSAGSSFFWCSSRLIFSPCFAPASGK